MTEYLQPLDRIRTTRRQLTCSAWLEFERSRLAGAGISSEIRSNKVGRIALFRLC